MKKRSPGIALLILGVLLLAFALAWADEENKEEKKAELPSGKELYRNNCKSCHGPDSAHGEYTPMHLIQEQWERFFAEQYEEAHADLPDTNFGGKPVLEVITDKMLERIKEFAIEGAADSEHPMTCG